MKIHLNMMGKPLAKADFAMLRAALATAQALTPTAAASDRAHAAPEPTEAPAEALAGLFGNQAGVDTAALHGSFNPASARDNSAESIEK